MIPLPGHRNESTGIELQSNRSDTAWPQDLGMAVHPGTQIALDIDTVIPVMERCDAWGEWEAEVLAVLPGQIGAALAFVPLLTAREFAAFRLLGAGYDNHSIARSMSISERTAKRHVTAILIKLGLTSRLQAGLAAMAMTLVAAGPGRPAGRRSPALIGTASAASSAPVGRAGTTGELPVDRSGVPGAHYSVCSCLSGG